MTREFFKGNLAGGSLVFACGEDERRRTHVWLAGVGAWRDERGNVLAGDFDAQVHATFRQIERTPGAGGRETAGYRDDDGVHPRRGERGQVRRAQESSIFQTDFQAAR